MRKPYVSDVSREKFQEIQPLLQSVRKRTKPTTIDMYEVFCAVLYLLRSGCQWRMLPGDFPKWGTVYSYFAKWSKLDKDGSSVLDRILKAQVGAAREKQGRSSLPTLLIVDSQSAQEHGHSWPRRL
jgi:transposase